MSQLLLVNSLAGIVKKIGIRPSRCLKHLAGLICNGLIKQMDIYSQEQKKKDNHLKSGEYRRLTTKEVKKRLHPFEVKAFLGQIN